MRLLYCFLFSITFFSISAQLSEIEFGSDEKFDLVTWNLENFPKKGDLTRDSVAVIVEAMKADVIALQEIEDKDQFNALLAMLPGYDGFFDPNFFGGLAYIYNESTVEVTDIFEIYTNSSYWNPFPRAPFVLEFIFQGKQMYCINNHLKCCGDGFIENNNEDDEEFRRLLAVELLKEYMETNLDSDYVFMVGDLNDNIAENSSNNVFQPFLDEPSHYQFADLEIALGSVLNWSYPSWPSHLDHILITNEIYDAFNAQDAVVKTLKVDEFLPGGFGEYDNRITDHRPVGLSLNASIISSTDNAIETSTINIYPNPAIDILNIHLDQSYGIIQVKIFNSVGQEIENTRLESGTENTALTLTGYSSGIYYVHIQDEKQNQVLPLIIE